MADGSLGIHFGEERTERFEMNYSPNSDGHLVLALDPGRDKIGFAFTDLDAELLLSGIFPAAQQENFFSAVMNRRNLSEWSIEGNADSLTGSILFVAIGNGTHSQAFTENVKAFLPFEVLSVDEHSTTLEARSLYWKIHKPGIFTRLLPEGLRVPDRVLDDLAAWAIAIRAVKKYRDMRPNKL